MMYHSSRITSVGSTPAGTLLVWGVPASEMHQINATSVELPPVALHSITQEHTMQTIQQIPSCCGILVSVCKRQSLQFKFRH
jgi:hypothetical protein